MGLSDDKELTKAEQREFIERMSELIRSGVLNRDDRREIYCVCMMACNREMAKIGKEQ